MYETNINLIYFIFNKANNKILNLVFICLIYFAPLWLSNIFKMCSKYVFYSKEHYINVIY